VRLYWQSGRNKTWAGRLCRRCGCVWLQKGVVEANRST